MSRRNSGLSLGENWKDAGVLLLILFVTSCGGGSSGGGGGMVTPPPAKVNPPVFTYSSSYYAYTAGIAAQAISASTQSGDRPFTWSISPALPPGLVLDTANGTISGQPANATPAANYTINAANAGGQANVTLTIAVAAAPLLDLGQSSPASVWFANSSILSQGGGSSGANEIITWLLQDFTSGAVLARGENITVAGAPGSNVELENNVMIDLAADGMEIRSATTGQVLATITAPANVAWYHLASDGSYLAAGSPTALTIWSTSGQLLLSQAGNYATAIVYAAPGQILIAQGPAGANVIETVSVPSGTSLVSPTFLGTFNTWFVDGQGFLTNTGNAVWTYSNTAAQRDFTSVTTVAGLAGQGNWIWTFDGRAPGVNDGTLTIYQIGASTSPVLSAAFGEDNFAFPSGGTIGITGPGSEQISVVDLSGAIPTSTTYTLPYVPVSYAAVSPTKWIVGDQFGVVFDGTSLGGAPRTLTLGAALGIAGGTSYFSVATASGNIFYYNSSDDSLVGTISFPGVSELSSSSDGTVLAAEQNTHFAQSVTGRTLNVYSLPSGTVLNTFPYVFPIQPEFVLSASGSVMAEYFGNDTTNACNTQVVPTLGGATIYCDTTGLIQFAQLSPDGTLIAAGPVATEPNYITNIYQNGTLISAVPGLPIMWLDNGHLLLDEYSSDQTMALPMAIYDPLGNLLGNGAISSTIGCGQGSVCRVIAPNSIYTGSGIINYLTGAITWATGDPPPLVYGSAASTGSQVIITSGVYVLAQPY